MADRHPEPTSHPSLPEWWVSPQRHAGRCLMTAGRWRSQFRGARNSSGSTLLVLPSLHHIDLEFARVQALR